MDLNAKELVTLIGILRNRKSICIERIEDTSSCDIKEYWEEQLNEVTELLEKIEER